MQGFDASVIRETVGPAAFYRGLEYAHAGAVLELSTIGGGESEATLIGSVQGSAPDPYSVVVTAIPAVHGLRGVVFGSCTCPVGDNCKHVAAVMYAAGRMDESERLVGDATVPAAARWERELRLGGEGLSGDRLGALLPGLVDAAPEEPIGLLIEPKGDPQGRLTLSMRPVIRNDRGRWVRGGISWSDIGYGYVQHRTPAAQLRLLQEIQALQLAGDHPYSFGSRSAGVELTIFPSRRIWDVLDEARSVGLAVISAADGTPVAVTEQPVVAGLDLADRDGDWVLTASLSQGGEPLPGPVTLLGDPAHGVAWWGGRVDGAAAGPWDLSGRVLHLTRLARSVDADTRRLVEVTEPIVIPAADRQRFLRDFLPVLRSRLELTSRDGSVDIPVRRPGRLTLAMTHDERHRVGVSWRWRYPVGDDVIDVPVGDRSRPELHDPEAESAVLAAVLPALAPLPTLRTWGPLGPELAPRTGLTGRDALRFEREVLPALRASGEVDVEVAEGAVEFREAADAPIVVLGGSAETGTDWFDLTVTVTVDGEDVPFVELFRALATGQEFLILSSGTYFPLDRPELHQLRALIQESWSLADTDGDVLRISRYQASFWAELAALGILDEQAAEWSRSVRELARCAEIPEPVLPADLRATLRPYQRAGYTWLSFLYDNGLGGVLADDMGLGKTVQALALICKAREDKPGGPPFLVVAPTSVVGNWAAEARRFAPELNTLMITETESRRGIPLDEACAGTAIVVTSYALFRMEFDQYERIGWSGLLIDEAQQIKNHQSKGYQCARRLPAPFKLVITGTPMENNLMELWAMFSIVAPGLLGSPKRFTEYYRKPIERDGDAELLAQLRSRIRPLLMRRTKQQVVADLPPKTEQVVELELEPKHRRVYQRYLQRERRKVLGLLGDMDRHRFEIFRSLMLLRQAALDTGLVDAEHAAVPSTKLDALMEILAGAAGDGHRVLVFSQFTRFLDRARRRLIAAGIEHCYLDGRTRHRGAVLDEFKNGNAPVFLISLKAGGVGLNLTEADYCILLDPWWNPATEAQAVDRVHRIGQDRPVMVYRLVAKDTIEDKVMALKARKAALFSSIMADGGVGAGGLSAGDIRGLLE